MSERDDDRFRPRLGPPRARGAGRSSRFVHRVLKAATQAGHIGRDRPFGVPKRQGAKFGRGFVAARLAAGRQGYRSRRVAIKTRLVRLGPSGQRALHAHLVYIERAGVSAARGAGQAYGSTIDEADTDAFAARCQDDRHQFRCILAAEDATSLGDLRSYTRKLMSRVEQDLGTRLDWVAVDHWDTDNPHTHLVIRGKDETGKDLVIARDYISHGMRARAAELATEWLGPRTEQEIRTSLAREVTAERWTALDRTLQRMATAGALDLRAVPADPAARFRRSLLVGRLEHLAHLQLAQPTGSGTWTVSADAERTLRALGERGDIVRTLQRATGGQRREYRVFQPSNSPVPVIGRVAEKGLVDELRDQAYLAVDGIDGRAHYVTLPARLDVGDFPIGGIVSVTARGGPRASDRTIAALSTGGIYRPAHHLAVASASSRRGQDPAAFVAAHVRRLEALRRAGISERLPDGSWRVPADLPEQGQRFDAQRGAPVSVELRSALPIERQIRVIGATWLDQQLVAAEFGIAMQGFGAEVRQALSHRTAFLVEQQLAKHRGARLVIARDLLNTLRERELTGIATEIAANTGRTYRPLRNGELVSGTYQRALELTSGRFALLDDGQAFSLVPWRPVLASRAGQSVTAMMRGPHITWQFGKSRSLAR